MTATYNLLCRIVRRLLEVPKRGFPELRAHRTDFDTEWGTETEKIVWLTNPASKNFVHGVRYEACSPRACQWALETAGIAHCEFRFVDLGCGKGRPMLIASRYPFAKLVGVEYSAKLCRAARKNVAAAGIPDSRLEVVCMDAAEYEFAPQETFVYLHNPFGPEVLSLVFKKLRALARTRQVVIAYEGRSAENVAAEAWLRCFAVGPNIKLFRSAPPAGAESTEHVHNASRLPR